MLFEVRARFSNALGQIFSSYQGISLGHCDEEEVGLTRSKRWRMMSAFRVDAKSFIDTGFDDCENVWIYDLEDVHILHQRKTTPRNSMKCNKDEHRFQDRYT